MNLDVENQYSVAQALTGSAAVSTNVIDHTVANPGFTAGRPMAVFFSIPAVTTAADLVIEIETSDDEAFTSPTVIASGTIPSAEIVAGARSFLPLPPNFKSKRYTRVSYTAAGTHTVEAYLIPQSFQEEYFAFPNAYDVL